MTTMPLFKSIEELTPELMTNVMRASGEIGTGDSVTAVSAASFGDDGGLLSFLYRVSMEYSSGAQGPATAVVKFPTDDPNQRGIADALGFFNRECVFYNVVAPTAPFHCPTIYGQAQEEGSTDFVIIMEDLGHMDRIDQVRGASKEESETVLTALAKLHAHYWEHDDLDELSATFLPLDNPVYHAALPDVFSAGWAALKANAPDLLDPTVEKFGDNYSSHLGGMLAALNSPRTLLHGDYRSDNLLLDPDGKLAVVDFQITSVGNGAFDIAYFLSSSVTPEVRAEHGEYLLGVYHDTLTGEGVDFSFEDFMRGFQIALDFCLIYGVASFAGWESFGSRQRELMRTIASRTMTSIVDADALASLPAI